MLSLHELQYHNFGTYKVRWHVNVQSLQRQHDWLSAVTWQRYTVNEWAATTSGSWRVRRVDAPPGGLHVTRANHCAQARPSQGTVLPTSGDCSVLGVFPVACCSHQTWRIEIYNNQDIC